MKENKKRSRNKNGIHDHGRGLRCCLMIHNFEFSVSRKVCIRLMWRQKKIHLIRIIVGFFFIFVWIKFTWNVNRIVKFFLFNNRLSTRKNKKILSLILFPINRLKNEMEHLLMNNESPCVAARTRLSASKTFLKMIPRERIHSWHMISQKSRAQK